MGDLLREHFLEISAAVAVVGFVGTVTSYTAFLLDPAFLSWYTDALRDWNLWVMAIAPFVLLAGGWYAGEQVILRRRFEDMIDMERRHEYRDRIRELEETVEKLPSDYQERLEKQTEEFR